MRNLCHEGKPWCYANIATAARCLQASVGAECEGLGTRYLIEIDNADALRLARHVSGRRRSQLPDSR
jgi:hypothetical protein